MSLLSSVILPLLERELKALEPKLAEFLISQLELIGKELLTYFEGKMLTQNNLQANESEKV